MVRSTQAASANSRSCCLARSPAKSSTFSAVWELSTPKTSNCDIGTSPLGADALRTAVGGSFGCRRFFGFTLDRELASTAAVGLHLNPARLRGLSHRKVKMQHPIGVRRLNVLGVDRVAQLQLPSKGSLRPLGDQYVLALLVFRAPLCLDLQNVPLGRDVHTVCIHPWQVEADVESLVGLPDVHGHPHWGPSPRQQLVRQPIHLAKRVTKRVQ